MVNIRSVLLMGKVGHLKVINFANPLLVLKLICQIPNYT